MRIPVVAISSSTGRIQISFMPPCGRYDASRGFSNQAGQAPVCISAMMEASLGTGKQSTMASRKGNLGRITFTNFRRDANIVYAFVEAGKSAIVRSDDGGQSWIKVNQDYNVARRPFYFGEILVDPVDPDRIYNLNTRIHVSVDGGNTFAPWKGIEAIHGDHHYLWINPHDPRHVISGNDGGVGITRDRGNIWHYVGGLPLSQFYHVAVDDDVPYNVYGGLQDNSAVRGPSESVGKQRYSTLSLGKRRDQRWHGYGSRSA